jgi:hypothetical protein
MGWKYNQDDRDKYAQKNLAEKTYYKMPVRVTSKEMVVRYNIGGF